MMTDQVFAQAALLAGQLDDRQTELLKVFCQGAVSGLEARLRENVTAEEYRQDLLMAASLYALAALKEAGQEDLAEFRAGDLTVKRKGDGAGRGLRRQAEQIIRPWLKDSFAFVGV